MPLAALAYRLYGRIVDIDQATGDVLQLEKKDSKGFVKRLHVFPRFTACDFNGEVAEGAVRPPGNNGFGPVAPFKIVLDLQEINDH